MIGGLGVSFLKRGEAGMKMWRILAAAVTGVVLGAGLAVAGEKKPAEPSKAPARTLTFSTKSEEAKTDLRALQRRVESFQGGPASLELAKKIVAADPEFAMGQYYLSAVTPAPEGQKLLDKAVELSRNASEGERRFIETMVIARGKTPEQAIEPLQKLAADYPGERPFLMLLGQTLAGAGRPDEAKAAYEKAIALDGSTPRAYALIGNHHLMKGDYQKARALYAEARTKLPPRVPAGFAAYNSAFTYIYEGQPADAIRILTAYVDEYRNSDPVGTLPEVFIWNSIARINLENGHLEEAMKAYEKGFESVPGSRLSEDDKKIWEGRLHHGRGRTLARMGRHEDALKEADVIKKMIDEGGERGKQFVPSYHYLLGYLKLEAGQFADAIEHLEQADPEHDPFRDLLLARAYEKAGEKEKAKKTYQAVVDSKQNSLERALSYPEARRKLETL
jgi:tetratricopeptide (TPR) repeat protein